MEFVKALIIVGLAVALITAVAKWINYKLARMAVLLYYAESGLELPDSAVIRRYMQKVVNKSLGIREDRNGSL